jgi:hypothetical protein
LKRIDLELDFYDQNEKQMENNSLSEIPRNPEISFNLLLMKIIH